MNFIKELYDASLKNISFVLVTIISKDMSAPGNIGGKMIVFNDGTIKGTIGGGVLEKRAIDEALALLKKCETKKIRYNLDDLNMTCGGEIELFFEVIKPGIKVVIMGAGHIGYYIGRILEAIQINYEIVDEREEYANKTRFPGAQKIWAADFDKILNEISIDERSYIVIVTRGHTYDELCLNWAVRTKAKYIGMIGSKSKIKIILDSLKKKNANLDTTRIYTPIGLNIDDGSPQEIAVSIVSEILKIKNDKSGAHCRILLDN